MKRGINPSILDRVFAHQRKDPGMLIAIVGFNGSGKTTQVSALAERFRSFGREVIETRQPTDWYRNDGSVIEFQAAGGSREQARILALFGAADRLRHIHHIINPALHRGAVVICERYVYAHFAAFISRGLDFDFVVTINSGIPKPDFAFYLDVPPSILLERVKQRNRGSLRFEERSLERISCIIKYYDEMRDHLTRIDGLKSPNEVASSIFNEIISTCGDAISSGLAKPR